MNNTALFEIRQLPSQAFDDDRSEFGKDRARIIHSSAFRRLQAKTQVLGIDHGDIHRTRLTHSMEVAQIAVGIVKRLPKYDKFEPCLQVWLPAPQMMEAICYAHDLGHPPFGHAGEIALNYAVLKYSDKNDIVGFEGNGQTLRILNRLEAHTKNFGLNLTRRTLLGVLKYPVKYSKLASCEFFEKINIDYKNGNLMCGQKYYDEVMDLNISNPPKCYLDTEDECVNWILAPFSPEDRDEFVKIRKKNKTKGTITHESIYKSLDCSIMDVADLIAYRVHDFEDGVYLKLISGDDWTDEMSDYIRKDKVIRDRLGSEFVDKFKEKLFARDEEGPSNRKRAFGAIIGSLISSIEFIENENFSHPLLRWNVRLKDEAEEFTKKLQKIIDKNIILSSNVMTLEFKAKNNVVAIFRAFRTDPERLLGDRFRVKRDKGESETRIIADYIAGMTDEFANKMYERLYIPRNGTAFGLV